ncbi:MAG: TM2 domain-containing protein [Treponema sp.]|nr:TM2 domain-containing protein [Treponema sp.]
MYSTGLAYLFWLLSGCGVLGFHRFYLGKIPTGVLWMCTGGLFGIGALYDFFTLGGQVREANYHEAIWSTRQRPAGSWRTVHDGEARIVNEQRRESSERVLLRTAKNNRGIISPGEFALEAEISIEEAKKQLDALVNKGFAELRVRRSGSIVYVIPEFADADSPLEY